MRPALRLLSNPPKKGGIQVPVELTPLFIACGAAIASMSYFTYKKFRYDGSLRITKNPDQSGVNDLLAKTENSDK
ncbi:hypothetical protein ACO0QE_004537 [Hanseniaspora vineae]